MNEIKNVLICGIGAVGSIYANKINEYKAENLRVLVDKERFKRYKNFPKIFNGKKLYFNYILPETKDFKADLIIIATKYNGFNEAVNNIENFIKEDTVILSLLNGVTSEEILAQKYGFKHLLLSYFIGHSAMRNGDNITHDGVGRIVFGAGGKCNSENSSENIIRVKNFFDKAQIDYEIPKDMYHSLWLKYMLNISSNQPSAILKLTFGQMQANPKFINFMLEIMKEVQILAEREGVNNTDIIIEEAVQSFKKMTPEGKTSMLQDIEAHRKTEVEMFAGHIVELGKKYNIPTPYNKILGEMIDILQSSF